MRSTDSPTFESDAESVQIAFEISNNPTYSQQREDNTAILCVVTLWQLVLASLFQRLKVLDSVRAADDFHVVFVGALLLLA